MPVTACEWRRASNTAGRHRGWGGKGSGDSDGCSPRPWNGAGCLDMVSSVPQEAEGKGRRSSIGPSRTSTLEARANFPELLGFLAPPMDSIRPLWPGWGRPTFGEDACSNPEAEHRWPQRCAESLEFLKPAWAARGLERSRLIRTSFKKHFVSDS